mmetsp:Transcript_7920/g.13764  ORF Transcript_7920/g.13764 Transcript_7920/m.13764 type:complete len:85 (+) Transcript_7920:30-284(+)
MGLFHVAAGAGSAFFVQIMVNGIQKLPLYAKPWRYGASLVAGGAAGYYWKKFDVDQRQKNKLIVEKYKARQLEYNEKHGKSTNH